MGISDLARHIQETPLVDSHEHLAKEDQYVQQGPDILGMLFQNYISAELRVGGASQAAVDLALDAGNPDVAARFEGIRPAWENCRHTGYGEAVQLIAERVLGMGEISADAIVAAQERSRELRRPGQRLRLLRDVGNLDHVQIDDFCLACEPDASGPEFFLYDLSWAKFVNAEHFAPQLHEVTGVQVKDLASLRQAFAGVFAKYGPCAIAVKSQHAYNRTLAWEKRSGADAEPCLQKLLAQKEMDLSEKLCLGDWCLARGVELAIEHNLPIKIHTGYYAGHSRMRTDRIHPGHLCPLLIEYPKARFVLMHAGYPYSSELIAITKHFANVYMDFCWAWSMDPYSSSQAVRKLIHSVPANKVFAFGGDVGWPTASVGYAVQARQWLTRTLEQEVREHLLTERQAIELAGKWMSRNQYACFDIDGTRQAIRQAMAQTSGPGANI